jgi:hypothetical protein
MTDYKIGKDIQELTHRMERLERMFEALLEETNKGRENGEQTEQA